MTSFTAREVRSWALANGINCPDRGPVQQRVIDAYLAAVHPDAGIADLPEPVETVPEGPVAEDDWEFTVGVTMQGHEAAALAIEGFLVEALWAAFTAGRGAERQDLLARLSGDGA